MVYALLVGINDYASGIGRLRGCLSDVQHISDYLRDTVGAEALALQVLKDADATRTNIVQQFQQHLGRATVDDTVFFHYSGHGAQWASAPEFVEFFPDGKDEGLVCYDSRQPNGCPFDLADKELAVLIADVARAGAHVAISLDCCHSGSGTRDVDDFDLFTARRTHEVLTPRPFESYLDGYYARQRRQGERISIPRSRHVLLSACDRTEKAMERKDLSGVFTSTLLASLESLGPDVSYADLFVRCRALIRREVKKQTPQFEGAEDFNANAGFLGRAVAAASRRFRVYFDTGAWTIDAGAVEGVAVDAVTPVTIFNRDGSPAGVAGTRAVRVDKSTLDLSFPGDPAAVYTGELTGFGAAPLPVLFEGDAAARRVMQAALDADRSIGVALTDVPEAAHYRVVVSATGWAFERCEPRLLIRGSGRAQAEQAAAALTPAMKAVARWERTRTLRNRRTRLDTSRVEFVLAERLDDGSEHIFPPVSDVTLDYPWKEGAKQPVKVALKARNRSGQPLYLALLHFSQRFGIRILYKDRLAVGDAWVTMWGDAPKQFFTISDPARNEETEELLLLISTDVVDEFALQQANLTLGEIDPTRGMGDDDDERETEVQENDWFTLPLRVRVVRRIEQVGSADVEVADGAIVIKAHPAVTAQVNLAQPPPSGRGADDGSDFHQALARHGFELLNFAGTRGDARHMLELSDIQNADSLRAAPLSIEVRVPVGDDEAILPVVFDGQHAMLAGDAVRDDAGHTQITIDHIPDVPSHRRSLGGSLKLYFFKTCLKRARINQLRWIEYGDGDAFTYRADGVRERVAAARNVLLLVHGIIGDTEGMVTGVRECGMDRAFDLVLTYDYENLSTPIDATARQMKSDLADVGLDADDNRRLTLLVHSMGGLVSRWFIEREGGNAVVDHLVMCGTPNGGSPFGRVDAARKILGTLTTLAMNYLPVAIPYAGAILMLLNRSRALTPTLEQMNPASDFITTLNGSPDPGIRYTILAGDVHQYRDPADLAFDALLTKAAQGSLGDLLFASQPHDIAVGVDSIVTVRGGAAGAPAATPVACHHLNYFSSAAGRTALTAVEW